jgi:hypothetical protein
MAAALGIGWLGRDLVRNEQLAFDPESSAESPSMDRAPVESEPAAPPLGSASGPEPAEMVMGTGVREYEVRPPPVPEAAPVRPRDAAAAPTSNIAPDAAPGVAADAAPDAGAARMEREAGTIAAASAQVDSFDRPVSSPPAAALALRARRPPADATDDSWIAADRAEAERHLGGTLLTIPDLEVAEIAVRRTPDQPAVRVLQTLSDGTLLILTLHRIADSLPVAVPPGDVTITIHRGEFVLNATAAIEPDRLRTLVESAR